MVCRRFGFAVVVLSVFVGVAFARPFGRIGIFPRWQPPARATGKLPSIVPWSCCKVEQSPAQGQSLPTSAEGGTLSQQQGTVLVPVEGTGSLLPIGGKVPSTITHTVDPAALAKIEALMGSLLKRQDAVPITLPLDQATSDRLQRILMVLEWLLWLGGGVFGMSSAGKLLPWVVRVAGGLQSIASAQSQGTTSIPVAPLSSPPSR